MALAEIPSFDIDDTSHSSDALLAFNRLGLDIPMMNIALGDVGILADIHDLSHPLDVRELLDTNSTEIFWSYIEQAISFIGLSCVEVNSVNLLQEVPYEQSRIIPYATKIYSQEDPVHKVIRTAGDSGKHNDMDFLALHPVVYAAHLTIAGSGAVEASVASKLYNKNVFSNEGNPTHQREFGIGDLHLFVRQGAKRGNVLHAPSTHKFTSNLGGRAYVHGSFGVALEWQEYTSNGAKSQLQVPQSN